jgi:hypothetical protein
VVGRDEGMPARAEPRDGAWPTLLYRARLRDVIMSTIFSLPAAASWAATVLVAVQDGPGAAGFPALFATLWSVVATLLWLNARQRVLLTADALVVQRRLRRSEIPYGSIAELSLDLARGVTLRTVEGRRLLLPWPPLRTASGAGLSRAREVHDELARRVAAATATSGSGDR